MKLYFLRHAIAEDKNVSGRDPDRQLTSEGMRQMKEAAQGMKKLGLVFDRVVSSPFVRARQTAEIACKGVGYKGTLEFHRFMEPTANFRDLERGMRDFGEEDRVLLVGHQPSLGDFISHMVSARADLSLNVGKASLCLVETGDEADVPPGELKWMLTAKQLAALGE